ncbi:PREDICTED: uncharacterized protein LOC101291591 [Fragaria vesca subsp. vesca]|uniref:uncharacterized protein LOC101291591 n=1 Tax=Fragaria vesca subsp. vesca TaxID=101020 RepID=UPI0002C2DEE7|nr:PREDICTED: uncharacterized protein LOC101291591 [Fragaria vesca subsp. vesca]
MGIDDYDFTKPGAIPFQWEIRPGVPKVQHQKQPPPPPLPPPQVCEYNLSPLKPPPAGSVFVPPGEPRTRSFRSGNATRTRSERWRFEKPNILARGPEIVSSPGCFLSPLLRRKLSGKKGKSGGARTVPEPAPKSEPDCSSDLETLARWSVSSRKSLLSPFRDSQSSMSSYSSYRSSPRPVSDAEWAGFGLF